MGFLEFVGVCFATGIAILAGAIALGIFLGVIYRVFDFVAGD